ncbi:hypothetical protein [Porphyromonas cangingivalis]|uniref:Cell division protein ZapB n=1 Tax=Porphyromonas cangingivalis TaxID=36874 RepID=A0A1T4NLZ0_PORCN|nr:hypothetical protein [Porphyromonas cangingivalis]SJZ80115.1 hypothetical protein SAMN02745205_01935 [Porphyromonas cangingivalis]VEJ01801.1 Uncharacterised protein [Porphyromonas cangingivalis]
MNEQSENKQRQRQAGLIVGIALLILIIIGGGYKLWQQGKTIDNITAQSELDRQFLEEEYNELSLQYEGYKFSINNDSLVAQLSNEQAKVQRLMEELKTVKSTNAQRINELKRELQTLRKIMRNYVAQIDSLNAANQALRTENKEVKAQIHQVSTQRNQLQEEKQRLTKQVELASKLVVSNIRVDYLTDKGKTTKRIKKMKQFKISFSIDQNITTEPGMKNVYVRLYKPDDTLLLKSTYGTFSFEGGEIPYSISRQIEYTGEATSLDMYWDIDEYLSEGTYRLEIFADGYLVGRSSFTLQ